MSNRETNLGGMWEEDGFDTPRPPAGYLRMDKSNGQKAFSVGVGGWGVGGCK